MSSSRSLQEKTMPTKTIKTTKKSFKVAFKEMGEFGDCIKVDDVIKILEVHEIQYKRKLDKIIIAGETVWLKAHDTVKEEKIKNIDTLKIQSNSD